METQTFKLRGMSCAACASAIAAAIRAVPGVEGCSVNFGAEQAAVTYNPSSTTLAQIQAAVDEAGYTAQPLNDDGLAAIVPPKTGNSPVKPSLAWFWGWCC